MNNIIVAFPKQETAQNLKKILLQNGFHVDAVCSTGSQALQSANELGGGIVICGYRFVDMMYTELHEYLPDQFEMLLVAPARTTNDLDHFVKLQHEGIPMVFFDRIAPNLDTDRVLEDDYKGACTVVRHMIDGGCRKIAHIALPRRYLWAQKREKGYLQALKDRHLFTDEKLIVECEDVSEVYRITRQLVLHSGVDGIFAANDAFAVHVLSVLRQMKCRVPEEVAVCGYGNEPSTEVTFPALTTVNKDGYRVGNIAAGLLIRRIEDKEEVPTVTRLLKPELIVRDSTLSVDR